MTERQPRDAYEAEMRGNARAWDRESSEGIQSAPFGNIINPDRVNNFVMDMDPLDLAELAREVTAPIKTTDASASNRAAQREAWAEVTNLVRGGDIFDRNG